MTKEKTTTALTVAGDRFMVAPDGSDIKEAVRENMGSRGLTAADLTRVPVPAGGATTWVIHSPLGDDEETKKITGLIVSRQEVGALWVSEEPEEGRPPVLVTSDMQTAERRMDKADIPPDMWDELQRCRMPGAVEVYDWAALSYSQWNSATKGKGKRVKERVLLFVQREGAMFPIVLSIPPGSRAVWDMYVRDITFSGLAYYRVLTDFSLTKVTGTGVPAFSQVVPEYAGTVEGGSAVRDYWRDLLEGVAEGVAEDSQQGNDVPV